MNKSREAFRTISEVSEWLDTPAHVLRFWESKFTQIKPVKRAGGRRYYRPEDMALLGGIKTLLHDQGMTIKGVQKLLRDNGNRHVMALGPKDMPEGTSSEDIPDIPVLTVAVPGSARQSAPPRPTEGSRLAEPFPAAPALMLALAQVNRSRLAAQGQRIAPLVARLVEIRDRMARG